MREFARAERRRAGGGCRRRGRAEQQAAAGRFISRRGKTGSQLQGENVKAQGALRRPCQLSVAFLATAVPSTIIAATIVQ